MSLLVLESTVKGRPDAFIKLDELYYSLIGYPKAEGNFMWLIDNESGKFSNRHAYLKGIKNPRFAGIFRVIDNKYELYWVLGDINLTKQKFEALTAFEPFEDIIKEPEEALPDEPPILNITEAPPDTFWDCNKSSYEELFKNNPENLALSELIPGSRWVNVTEDDYVFGIIYDEDSLPLYLCYAFPLPWSDTPPEKLEGYCQWIPLDFTSPHDNGYWVIYVNAKTGERVK